MRYSTPKKKLKKKNRNTEGEEKVDLCPLGVPPGGGLAVQKKKGGLPLTQGGKKVKPGVSAQKDDLYQGKHRKKKGGFV